MGGMRLVPLCGVGGGGGEERTIARDGVKMSLCIPIILDYCSLIIITASISKNLTFGKRPAFCHHGQLDTRAAGRTIAREAGKLSLFIQILLDHCLYNNCLGLFKVFISRLYFDKLCPYKTFDKNSQIVTRYKNSQIVYL